MIPRQDLHRAEWYTSSYSSSSGSNCVEVAPAVRLVGVRDSKHHAAGVLAVAPHTWATFLTAVRSL